MQKKKKMEAAGRVFGLTVEMHLGMPAFELIALLVLVSCSWAL